MPEHLNFRAALNHDPSKPQSPDAIMGFVDGSLASAGVLHVVGILSPKNHPDRILALHDKAKREDRLPQTRITVEDFEEMDSFEDLLGVVHHGLVRKIGVSHSALDTPDLHTRTVSFEPLDGNKDVLARLESEERVKRAQNSKLFRMRRPLLIANSTVDTPKTTTSLQSSGVTRFVPPATFALQERLHAHMQLEVARAGGLRVVGTSAERAIEYAALRDTVECMDTLPAVAS